MPFQSRALNVARPRFGESGTKPDVTSTRGPNMIAPRSVLFIRLDCENTKVLFLYLMRLKSLQILF